MSKQIVSRILC